jgi:hypothetical protein
MNCIDIESDGIAIANELHVVLSVDPNKMSKGMILMSVQLGGQYLDDK